MVTVASVPRCHSNLNISIKIELSQYWKRILINLNMKTIIGLLLTTTLIPLEQNCHFLWLYILVNSISKKKKKNVNTSSNERQKQRQYEKLVQMKENNKSNMKNYFNVNDRDIRTTYKGCLEVLLSRYFGLLTCESIYFSKRHQNWE